MENQLPDAGSVISKPTLYVVKVYSGGQVVQTYDADLFSTSKGETWITLPSGRRQIVGGSCSVKSTHSGPSKEATLEALYEANLYSGGRVVETVKVNHFSGYEGKVYLTDVFGEVVVFGGTYVIRRLGAHLNVPYDNCKYRVTAYSGGVSIGTWYATYCSAGKNMLYLNGVHFYDVIVGGNFVAEEF